MGQVKRSRKTAFVLAQSLNVQPNDPAVHPPEHAQQIVIGAEEVLACGGRVQPRVIRPATQATTPTAWLPPDRRCHDDAATRRAHRDGCGLKAREQCAPAPLHACPPRGGARKARAHTASHRKATARADARARTVPDTRRAAIRGHQ